MRYILVCLVMVFLTSCVNDLPPVPETPGVSGQFVAVLPDWAFDPVGFDAVYSDSKIKIEGFDDFIYKKGYVWNEGSSKWEIFTLKGNSASSKWLSDSGSTDISIDESYADENDELFVVLYTCTSLGQGNFDCHGNKWQMKILTFDLCGNGVIDSGEGCDAGSRNTDTPCTPAYGSSCNYCSTSCRQNTVQGQYCGDGDVNGLEECDDNNAVSGDGCSTSCTEESPQPPVQECGNGVVEPGEECDDENTADDCACLADCTTPYCGDGQVCGSEKCDDGNTIDGDGCSNICLAEESTQSLNLADFNSAIFEFEQSLPLSASVSTQLSCGNQMGVGVHDVTPISHYLENSNDKIGFRAGFSEKFGGVGASFELINAENGISKNILEGRSTGGAGWQWSAMATALDSSGFGGGLFNQAAGNAYGQSGYDVNYLSSADKSSLWSTKWVNFYSDSFNYGEGDAPTSPCESSTNPAMFDKGLKSFNSRNIKFVDDTSFIHIIDKTILKSDYNQYWKNYGTLNAFYVNRKVAKDLNMRAYFYENSGSRIGPYNFYSSYDNSFGLPSNVIGTPYCDNDANNPGCGVFVARSWLELVFNIGGKDISLLMKAGHLGLTHIFTGDGPYCSSTNIDDNCGHIFIYIEGEGNHQEGKSFAKDSVRTNSFDYFVFETGKATEVISKYGEMNSRRDCFAQWPSRLYPDNVASFYGKNEGVVSYTTSSQETTDYRFICYNKRIYACGWELEDPQIAESVSANTQKGDWTCNGNYWE